LELNGGPEAPGLPDFSAIGLPSRPAGRKYGLLTV
jgi:hypothetical protein